MGFPLDVTNSLPFPDNFFDVIYGSEVIEHIDLAEARQFSG
jgi:predicted SAM-dependent methyltransferase